MMARGEKLNIRYLGDRILHSEQVWYWATARGNIRKELQFHILNLL